MSESSPADCSAAWCLTDLPSASVDFLFLISFDVMLVSPAGRQDADDFLALSYLPEDMHHEKHGSGPSLSCAAPTACHCCSPVSSMRSCRTRQSSSSSARAASSKDTPCFFWLSRFLDLVPLVTHLYIQA